MVKNRIIHILFVLLSIITISAVCNAQVRVKGYYRKDGAYVRPHVRSNPDGNPYNNWSYPGNVNPYTGKVATGNPETLAYLQLIIPQYFISNKSGIWSLSLIVHSKG